MERNPDKFRLEHRPIICHVQTDDIMQTLGRSISSARSAKENCERFVKLFAAEWARIWEVGFSWQRPDNVTLCIYFNVRRNVRGI
jgi:hypothetical protein